MDRTVKCRSCGRKFNATGALGKLCPTCIENEQLTYLKVRDFVKDNPGVSIHEICEILSISRSKILGYVREERLEITSNGKAILNCKNCGKQISTGIFCSDCKRVHGNIKKVDDETANSLRYNSDYSWTYKANKKTH